LRRYSVAELTQIRDFLRLDRHLNEEHGARLKARASADPE
jgi:hypothetical protein